MEKARILTLLRQEFDRWEALFAGLREEQFTATNLVGDWSIKDILVHLTAWQQISIARMEAARFNREPEFPEWLAGMDPFTAEMEENRDHVNARIYLAHRVQSWSSVHRAWRDGFLKFMELAEVIPEDELLDAERFSWLKGYSLLVVLQGSYEHHEEHLQSLLLALNQKRK
ncbi:MAG: ClbS/DfsB family four-helix bundle protein [Chloroflexi bacterium]|nr:ClbS/DfsB family four-helix bundle protein [Chloroflexota bacterium]